MGGVGVYGYQNVIVPRLAKSQKLRVKKKKMKKRIYRCAGDNLDAKNEALKIKREAEEETRKFAAKLCSLKQELLLRKKV